MQADSELCTEASIDAEIQASAKAIFNALVDADAEILAQTQTEDLMSDIGMVLHSAYSFTKDTTLPGMGMLLGLRLAQPWMCQQLNGGVPCPMFEPENYVMVAPKMFGQEPGR